MGLETLSLGSLRVENAGKAFARSDVGVIVALRGRDGGDDPGGLLQLWLRTGIPQSPLPARIPQQPSPQRDLG